jgi:hypothetical protein
MAVAIMTRPVIATSMSCSCCCTCIRVGVELESLGGRDSVDFTSWASAASNFTSFNFFASDILPYSFRLYMIDS